jgi:serine/threonine protein kinase
LTDLHLIKLLATFKKDEMWHFLFPLADCNLEEFMLQHDPEESKEYLIWILSQLRGITYALSKIHTLKVKIAGAERVAPPVPNSNSSLQVPTTTSRTLDSGTGYHHDIKPQNILLLHQLKEKITTPSPERGVLQIADFGVGKLHTQPANGLSKGTKNQRGTPTYAAPESVVKASSKEPIKISRPYDVWSLGCVITEVLVWFLLGKDEWQKFNLKRTGYQSDDEIVETDGFFYVETINGEKKAKVRDEVEDMFEILRRHRRCNDGTQSLKMIVNLARMVLDVDPATRVVAASLAMELDKIIAVAKTDPDTSINRDDQSKAARRQRLSVKFSDVEHMGEDIPTEPSHTTNSAPSITITPIDRTDTERTELSQSSMKSTKAHRSTPPDSPPFPVGSLG